MSVAVLLALTLAAPGVQGLAVGLDNGSVVIFHRESDEARTLTKLRTLALGVNMGHAKGLPEPAGTTLGVSAVMAIGVTPAEDSLAVCTRDRRLLMITMPGLPEASQVRVVPQPSGVPAGLVQGRERPCPSFAKPSSQRQPCHRVSLRSPSG